MWKSELKIHELIVYKGSDDNPLYVKHFRLDNMDNLYHPRIQECLSLIKKTFPTPESGWKKEVSIEDQRFEHSFFDEVYSQEPRETEYLIPLNERQKSEHLLYAPFAGKVAEKQMIYLSYESYIYPVFVTNDEKLFAPVVPLPKAGGKYEDMTKQELGPNNDETLTPFTKDVDYFEIEVTNESEDAAKQKISTSYIGLNGLFPDKKSMSFPQYKKKKEEVLTSLQKNHNITFKKIYLFTGIALIELYKRKNGINKNYDYSYYQRKSIYFHKFLLSTKNDEPFYDLKGDDKQVHIFIVHDKNKHVKGISMIMNQEALEVFKENIQGEPIDDKWNVIVFEHDGTNVTNGMIDFDSKMYETGIVQYDDLIDLKGTVKEVMEELHKRVATPEDVSNNHKAIFRFTSHPIVQYDMSKVIWLLCNELKITNEDIVCKMNGMKNLEVFCKNNGILVLMLTSKYSTPEDVEKKFGSSEVRVHTYHPTFQITKSSGLKSLEPWQIFERENGRRYQNINKQELNEELKKHYDKQNVLLIFSDKRILKYKDDTFLWRKNVLLRYLT